MYEDEEEILNTGIDEDEEEILNTGIDVETVEPSATGLTDDTLNTDIDVETGAPSATYPTDDASDNFTDQTMSDDLPHAVAQPTSGPPEATELQQTAYAEAGAESEQKAAMQQAQAQALAQQTAQAQALVQQKETTELHQTANAETCADAKKKTATEEPAKSEQKAVMQHARDAAEAEQNAVELKAGAYAACQVYDQQIDKEIGVVMQHLKAVKSLSDKREEAVREERRKNIYTLEATVREREKQLNTLQGEYQTLLTALKEKENALKEAKKALDVDQGKLSTMKRLPEPKLPEVRDQAKTTKIYHELVSLGWIPRPTEAMTDLHDSAAITGYATATAITGAEDPKRDKHVPENGAGDGPKNSLKRKSSENMPKYDDTKRCRTEHNSDPTCPLEEDREIITEYFTEKEKKSKEYIQEWFVTQTQEYHSVAQKFKDMAMRVQEERQIERRWSKLASKAAKFRASKPQ